MERGKITMAVNLYKYNSDGTKTKLTNREVKQYIMKVHDWDAETYRKKYDIFKNKVRASEEYKRAKGAKVTAKSPVALLYKQAKAMKREGKNYRPSIEMQRIMSYQSVSMGKRGKELARSKRYQESREEQEKAFTAETFGGLVNYYPQAQELKERIKDPVALETALKDFADKVHAVRDESGKYSGDSDIPFGEKQGSPDSVDFNVDDYIKEHNLEE